MLDVQAQIGRISGIPIVIDASFILLVGLWGYHYFTAGDLNLALMGLWVVCGVALSILIHELAHAFAGRFYRVGTRYVELNGLGGLCHFVGTAPNRWADIVILLAGPMSNLALWMVFSGLGAGITMLAEGGATSSALPWFLSITSILASINFLLFWFNLLPSHPLDGGRALANLLAGPLGYDRAMRVVAWMGMLVGAWLIVVSFGYGMFTALIAVYLFMHNQQVLQAHASDTTRRRWDK